MGHKPPQEREFSAQHASVINLAYSILKSPLSRANYLLASKGVNAGEAFEGTIDDPELLMEVGVGPWAVGGCTSTVCGARQRK